MLSLEGEKHYFYKIKNNGQGVVVEIWASKQPKTKAYPVKRLGTAQELHTKLIDLEFDRIA